MKSEMQVKQWLESKGIRPRLFKALSGNYSSQVFDIDDRFILKINPNHEFENEVRALNILKDSSIPTPKVILHEENSLVITKLKGRNLNDVDLSPNLYQQIGEMMKQIHSISLDDDFLFEYDRKKLNKIIELDIPNGIKSFLSEYKIEKQNKLVHGDPAKGNILTDGKTITGIIDWEWAQGGNPARDIAQFHSKHDEKYWESFNKGYGDIPRDTTFYRLLMQGQEILWINQHHPESLDRYLNKMSRLFKGMNF